MGLVIPFVNFGIGPWYEGMIIGALGMTPFMFLTYGRTENIRIATRIVLHGAILGAGVGAVSSYLIP